MFIRASVCCAFLSKGEIIIIILGVVELARLARLLSGSVQGDREH